MITIPQNLQELAHSGEYEAFGRNVGRYPRHSYTFPVQDNSLPLQVHFVGDDDMRGPCFRLFRGRPVFSLEFVYSGNVAFQQDGKHYPVVGPGEVFFFHRLRKTMMGVGPAGFCRKLALSLTGPLLELLLLETGVADVDVMAGDEGTEALLREMWALARERPTAGARLSGMACEVLFGLGRKLSRTAYPADVSAALELIEERVTGSLTLDELCGHACCSSSTLLRHFREHLGVSPMAHFLNRKMELAKRLLLRTELSIKEVAVQVGYDNQVYFSSEFRKRSGVSPSAFRRKRLKS